MRLVAQSGIHGEGCERPSIEVGTSGDFYLQPDSYTVNSDGTHVLSRDELLNSMQGINLTWEQRNGVLDDVLASGQDVNAFHRSTRLYLRDKTTGDDKSRLASYLLKRVVKAAPDILHGTVVGVEDEWFALASQLRVVQRDPLVVSPMDEGVKVHYPTLAEIVSYGKLNVAR